MFAIKSNQRWLNHYDLRMFLLLLKYIGGASLMHLSVTWECTSLIRGHIICEAKWSAFSALCEWDKLANSCYTNLLGRNSEIQKNKTMGGRTSCIHDFAILC